MDRQGKGKLKSAPRARANRKHVGPDIRDVALPAPLNTPSSDFRPYLDRARAGHLDALVEYYRNCFYPSDPAYYECLGFITVNGSNKQRLVIQRIMRASRWTGREIKSQTYEHWKQRLATPSERAAVWIKEQREEKMHTDGMSPSRSDLWEEYLKTSTAFSALTDEDKRMLRSGKRVKGDLKGEFAFPSCYLDIGLTPKQLFWFLAESAPGNAPSVAVRKYMAGDALNLSWSNPSRHKSLRKK